MLKQRGVVMNKKHHLKIYPEYFRDVLIDVKIVAFKIANQLKDESYRKRNYFMTIWGNLKVY